jgi:CRP-like cAMP-binding protein
MRLAYNSVRKRVAETLLKIHRQSGNKDNSIAVSRNNLASMAGTAQETASRTISDFCDEGLIKKQGSLLIILNEQKLERLKN